MFGIGPQELMIIVGGIAALLILAIAISSSRKFLSRFKKADKPSAS